VLNGPRQSAHVRAVLDLLLPPQCPGCGREGTLICSHCQLPFMRRLDEPSGVPIGLPGVLPAGIVQLEWCAAFTGPVRAALHALKYSGERRLAAPLGAFMAQRWETAGRGADLIVPVPVHATRRRERGFDQAEDLAKACGRKLGLPVCVALVRQERTVAQHALGRRDRAANVGHAFALRDTAAAEAVRGRWILLIDDITTTGATLSGCAAVLAQAGALATSALTVARER
jgi:ComF family protein